MTPVLGDFAPDQYLRYIEPFAGSGALFFYLQPKSAIIGDLNPEVTATYEAIKDRFDEVADYLESIPHTKEAYLKLRSLDPRILQLTQRAARLIFLMKGSFNGVYRTNRLGQFNVPFGTTVYHVPTRDELARVSKALKNTVIRTGNYKDWICDHGRVGDFIYLDPPYSASVRFRGEYGYEGVFRDSEVEPLLSVCKRLAEQGAKVMLSYKLSSDIEAGLPNWRIVKLDVPRSVGGQLRSRSSVVELLAMNY